MNQIGTLADGETSIAFTVAKKENKCILWLSKLTQDFCDSFVLGQEAHQRVVSGRILDYCPNPTATLVR